ncbi:DUF2628 domain-containing protein [uncultured Desulfovibrio sp.]|uniref:DUF2628 domain-containing protein n=1 Tax=uncultured Desulfovibrio sp. TaxID=167968 RepID=UPI00261DFABD|nr:DUF2628 domain-containing protein [uncultured Desulfovibrio sp.]
MATTIYMQHARTGRIRRGFTGFSWTVLFFGPLPMLWRRDWLPGLSFLLLYCLFRRCLPWLDSLPPLPFWLPLLTNVLLALCYNRAYTLNLLRQGYFFCETADRNRLAALALGLEPAQCCPPWGSGMPSLPRDRTLPAILILGMLALLVSLLAAALYHTPAPRPLPPVPRHSPLPPVQPIHLPLPSSPACPV